MSRWQTFGLALALGTLTGCQCGDDPFAGRLSENIGASFADCNEARIKFLAAKHNVQLAFAPCGRNAFKSYAWSPDGLRIAYQLLLSTYVMNADAPGKNNLTVPVPQALGPSTWLSPTRLALAIGPTEDTHPAVRIAVVDLPAPSPEDPAPPPGNLVVTPVTGLATVEQLSAADGGDLLAVGLPEEGAPRDAFGLDIASGRVTRAFDWLQPGFDTLTHTRGTALVAVGRGQTVTLHAATDGETVRTFDDATRGVLHPNGHHLALEHLGPEASMYGQRTWGEVPDAVRAREKRRTEAFEQRLPEHLRGSVRPPMISVVDLEAGERLTIASFLGDRFSWYEAAEGWGSFFLWGFEGRQVKRNVALVNMASHLDAARSGEARYGTLLHKDLTATTLEAVGIVPEAKPREVRAEEAAE